MLMLRMSTGWLLRGTAAASGTGAWTGRCRGGRWGGGGRRASGRGGSLRRGLGAGVRRGEGLVVS